jgi:O-antigen/teichoic acid export membrane protein
VAISVNQLLILLLWGVQPTVLALLARGENPQQIARFTNAVGLSALVPPVLVAFVPAISEAMLHGLMGASGRLQELATAGLRILAFLPPILVQEQLFTSCLMRARRTRPILYVNLWRLASLLLFVVLALHLTGWSGAVIGVGATALALAIEAGASYLYGKGAFRLLAEQWQRADR